MPDGFLTEEDITLWIKENANSFASLLKSINQGLKFEVGRDIDAMETVLGKKGFTIVLTTKIGATGVEILDDYRSRDKNRKTL
jgi:hypothetical protein